MCKSPTQTANARRGVGASQHALTCGNASGHNTGQQSQRADLRCCGALAIAGFDADPPALAPDLAPCPSTATQQGSRCHPRRRSSRSVDPAWTRPRTTTTPRTARTSTVPGSRAASGRRLIDVATTTDTPTAGLTVTQPVRQPGTRPGSPLVSHQQEQARADGYAAGYQQGYDEEYIVGFLTGYVLRLIEESHRA